MDDRDRLVGGLGDAGAGAGAGSLLAAADSDGVGVGAAHGLGDGSGGAAAGGLGDLHAAHEHLHRHHMHALSGGRHSGTGLIWLLVFLHLAFIGWVWPAGRAVCAACCAAPC